MTSSRSSKRQKLSMYSDDDDLGTNATDSDDLGDLGVHLSPPASYSEFMDEDESDDSPISMGGDPMLSSPHLSPSCTDGGTSIRSTSPSTHSLYGTNSSNSLAVVKPDSMELVVPPP